MPLRPDITDLLYDEDVGGNQEFTIIRKTVVRQKGRDGTPAVQTILARGSVQPADVNALDQIPEADRDKKVVVFRTTVPLQDGSSDSSGSVLSDEIDYLGERYKVIRTKDWSAWGMYVAYAAKTNREVTA